MFFPGDLTWVSICDPPLTQRKPLLADNKVEPNKPAYYVDVYANKIECSFEMIDLS